MITNKRDEDLMSKLIDYTTENYGKSNYLSTSGVLLIWGEAALAGEKLGLYKPDIAFFFSSFFQGEQTFTLKMVASRTRKEKKGKEKTTLQKGFVFLCV